MLFGLFLIALFALILLCLGGVIAGLVAYGMVQKDESFEDALVGAMGRIRRRMADMPDEDGPA